jgi:hypothetical protein
VIRAVLPRGGLGASHRDEMERKSTGTRFYSLKAIPRKERGDWRTDSASVFLEREDPTAAST